MKAIDHNKFAKEWISAWNSHNIDRILSHYANDIKITTPMIKLSLDIDYGSLKGIESVGDYWQKALLKMPNLNFELIEVTSGNNSIALYYKSVMNKKAIEVMFFNEAGKINKMIAHYT